MNKVELRDAITNCDFDIAEQTKALADEIRNGAKTREDADKVVSELRAKKADLEKQLASMEAPVAEEKRNSGWTELGKGMCEKRSVTLAGTGNVFVARDLAKAVANKAEILKNATYFYGANASSVVPVWPTHMTAAFVSEGGTVTPATEAMTRKQLIPAQAIASLPVSQMTLDLSAANFEAELPNLFGTSFAGLMAQQMCVGTGSMTGIFTDTNISLTTKAITIANLGAYAVALRDKNYANPVIVMSPTVYGQFLADTATDDSTKIMKEDLIRNKSIEGVKVIITGYAPSTYAQNDIIAVGGDLSNYAIAVAGELKVKAKDTASSDIVTFDAYSFFTGAAIIPGDFVGFKVA